MYWPALVILMFTFGQKEEEMMTMLISGILTWDHWVNIVIRYIYREVNLSTGLSVVISVWF